MTEPDLTEPQDEPGEPAETLEVPSFSEIETRGPGGTGFRITGPGSPDHLVRAALPGVLVLTGLIIAGSIIMAGQPFWEAMALLGIALVVAAVAKFLRTPKDRGE